jgi:hypothetical protein
MVGASPVTDQRDAVGTGFRAEELHRAADVEDAHPEERRPQQQRIVGELELGPVDSVVRFHPVWNRDVAVPNRTDAAGIEDQYRAVLACERRNLVASFRQLAGPAFVEDDGRVSSRIRGNQHARHDDVGVPLRSEPDLLDVESIVVLAPDEPWTETTALPVQVERIDESVSKRLGVRCGVVDLGFRPRLGVSLRNVLANQVVHCSLVGPRPDDTARGRDLEGRPVGGFVPSARDELAVLQVLTEELEDVHPHLEDRAVGRLRDRQFESVFGVVALVNASGTVDRFVDSLDGEVLVGGRGPDTDGFRRHPRDEVVEVEPRRNRAVDELFGVDAFARPQPLLALGDATAGCCRVDPIIQEGEIQRPEAAARRPGYADSAVVDVGPPRQVIQRTPVVVNHVPGEIGTGIEALLPGIAVGEHAPTARESRLARLGVEVLLPLALANRVGDQHDEPVRRQLDAGLLVVRVCLRTVHVTAQKEHARMRTVAVRDVAVRRDVEVRSAAERQPLYRVAVPLDVAGEAGNRVVRPVVESTQAIDERLSDAPAAGLEVVDRADSPLLGALLLETVRRPGEQIPGQLVLDVDVPVYGVAELLHG